MNNVCPVCMRPLPQDARAIKGIGAGGRLLFRVHQDKCADVVDSVARVGLTALLMGGRSLFAKRAPLLSGMVEEYARRRREGIR